MSHFVISTITVIASIVLVKGQADLNNSLTIDKLPIRDKALYLAAYLADNPALFHQLEVIFYASKPFREQSSKGPGGQLLLNAALDYMPLLLQSPDFLADLAILEDEMNMVNITDVLMYQKTHNLSKDDPQLKQRFAKAMFARTNKLRAVRRILMRKSFQDRLVRHANVSVNDQCYHDSMDFMDSLVGIKIPDKSNPFKFATLPWAIKSKWIILYCT